MKIIALQDTLLKAKQAQSKDLGKNESTPIKKGVELDVELIQSDQYHAFARLSSGGFAWVFMPHFQIPDGVKLNATTQVVKPITPPTQVNLPIPFLCQRDNQHNWSGSCNVTSLAMANVYLGINPAVDAQGNQLEDRLYNWMTSRGMQVGSPWDMAECARAWGMHDDFDPAKSTWKRAKEWLAAKQPIVCHGWFTKPGHIVVLRGYDDNKGGFYVNDPWGEWFASGYAHGTNRGNNLLYSYKMMRDLCGNDGDIWLHFLSRK